MSDTNDLVEEVNASNIDNVINPLDENLDKPKRKYKKTKKNNVNDDYDDDIGDNEKLNSISNNFSSFLSSNAKIENVNDEQVMVIPTGIDTLDYILGGGIRTKFTTLVGQSGGGKSTLACNIIKTGKKIWGEKFITIYADSEESMTKERFDQLGINGHVQIVNNISIERVFKLVDALCAFKEENKELLEIPSMVVWDSIACTQSEKIIDSDGPTNMDAAHRAKIISYYLPLYVRKLAKYNIALLAINQYRDDIDTGNTYVKKANDLRYGKQGKTIPGGHAVRYQSYHLLDVSQSTLLKDDPYGFAAVETNIKAVKNKSFKPNIQLSLVFSFDRGFLNFWSNFSFLKKTKFIEQSGPRCYLKSMPEVKMKQKQAITIYRENEEWRKAFDEDLKTALHITYASPSGDDLDQYDI